MGSSKILVAQPEIIFKDVFIIRDLYEMCREWLLDERFLDDTGTDRFIEKLYHEKRIQNAGKEIRIWWRTTHLPGDEAGTPSGYFKYHMDVNFLTIALTDVDIAKDGKKIRAQKGEIQVRITGTLEVDYKSHMEQNAILKAFKVLFEKMWMKQQVDYHYEYMLKKVQEFEAQIKAHLRLKNFLKSFEPYRDPSAQE